MHNVLIVTKRTNSEDFIAKSLKFENHQELDCFVKELEKKAWFDKDAKTLS